MFDVACDRPIEPILHVAIASGLRQGEVLGLHWDQIDLDAAVVRVEGALKPATGLGLVYGTTKENKLHAVVLGPTTVDILRRHCARQAERRLRVGEAYVDRGYVVTHGDGRPIHPQTLRKWWKKLLRRAAITQPWPRWHDLRHTNDTMLLELGVHPTIVAERFGHATTEQTTETYSHVTLGMQHQAAQMLDQRLYANGDPRGPEMDLFRPIQGGQRK